MLINKRINEEGTTICLYGILNKKSISLKETLYYKDGRIKTSFMRRVLKEPNETDEELIARIK